MLAAKTTQQVDSGNLATTQHIDNICIMQK